MRMGGGEGKAAVAVLTGAGLIGLSPILVRLSDLGPQGANFWRFALSAPILWLLAARISAAAKGAGSYPRAGILCYYVR